MARPDHVTPCLPFLRPGEVLLSAHDYAEYPNLPHVPAHLRLPRKQSPWEKRVRGALGTVLGRAAGPLGGAAGSRVVDNRVVDNPLARAAGNLAEGLSNARENVEDAVDDAVEYAMYGKPMEGGWTSTAGRFRVAAANAGGSPRHQALTDHRLFVVNDLASGWRAREPEPALAVEVPRQDIAELRPVPRASFPRGRFDLVFTDGSWIALSCSFQKDMEAIVRAFQGR